MPHETTLIVHASPSALKAFKDEILPLLQSKGVELRREEPTALCLFESKPSTSVLSDICHGLSLIKPALSLFVSYDRGPSGRTAMYIREGETFAYDQTIGTDGSGQTREYGPVSFMQAAFLQFGDD